MKLLSDLKTRIGFDREDIERLDSLESLVSSHLSHITEACRAELPEVGDDVDGDIDDQLWEDVQCWIRGIFANTYDPTYLEHRIEHERQYLDSGLEPRFFWIGLHLLRCELIDLIFAEHKEPTPELFKSLERALTLEEAIVLQACRDSLQVESFETIPALADGLAHEIRNPLNTVGLQLTILERRLDSASHSDDEYWAILKTVRCELDRLEDICSNLHHVAVSTELERQWYEVWAIFDAVRSNFELEHRDAHLDLRMSSDGEDHIYCDAEYVRRGLRFLLKSTEEAVEYAHNLHIEFLCDGEHAIFELSEYDRSPAADGNVFDWLHPNSDSWRGVGLSVAEEVARSHGGSLERVTASNSDEDRIRLLFPRPDF